MKMSREMLNCRNCYKPYRRFGKNILMNIVMKIQECNCLAIFMTYRLTIITVYCKLLSENIKPTYAQKDILSSVSRLHSID